MEKTNNKSFWSDLKSWRVIVVLLLIPLVIVSFIVQHYLTKPNWITTQATVQSSSYSPTCYSGAKGEGTRPAFSIFLTYRYTVNDQSLTGSGEILLVDHPENQSLFDKYKENGLITIRYNPANTTQTLIMEPQDKRIRQETAYFMRMLLLYSAPFVLLIIFFLRNRGSKQN